MTYTLIFFAGVLVGSLIGLQGSDGRVVWPLVFRGRRFRTEPHLSRVVIETHGGHRIVDVRTDDLARMAAIQGTGEVAKLTLPGL